MDEQHYDNQGNITHQPAVGPRPSIVHGAEGITQQSMLTPQTSVDGLGTVQSGKSFVIPQSSMAVVGTNCAAGQHDMRPDDTETEFEAETCSRCPYGRLVRRRQQ